MIHASRSPCRLASVSSVLLDVETRVYDQLFDPLISPQAMVHSSDNLNSTVISLNINSDYAQSSRSSINQSQSTNYSK